MKKLGFIKEKLTLAVIWVFVAAETAALWVYSAVKSAIKWVKNKVISWKN